MLNKRRNAAQKVADRLFAAEHAISEALARTAELNAVMPTAQAEADLSAVVGQEAFDGAAATFATLAEARRQIVTTHHAMDAARKQIGLRTVAFGDGTQKPPLFPSATESGQDIAA